jgi:hypothetical protein
MVEDAPTAAMSPAPTAQEKLMALELQRPFVRRITVHSKSTCVSNGGSRSRAHGSDWSVLHDGGSQLNLSRFT